MHPLIHFWTVYNNTEKCQRVKDIVYDCFSHGQRILVLVPSQQALTFVDKLLWQMPPDRFLPHAITYEPLEAAVIITEVSANLNQANTLLNLSPECPESALIWQFTQIHELYDKSDPTKEAQSKQKKVTYASILKGA